MSNQDTHSRSHRLAPHECGHTHSQGYTLPLESAHLLPAVTFRGQQRFTQSDFSITKNNLSLLILLLAKDSLSLVFVVYVPTLFPFMSPFCIPFFLSLSFFSQWVHAVIPFPRPNCPLCPSSGVGDWQTCYIWLWAVIKTNLVLLMAIAAPLSSAAISQY